MWCTVDKLDNSHAFLLSICFLLAAFPPESRTASHNLAQPTHSTISEITGVFSQHLSIASVSTCILLVDNLLHLSG